MGPMRPRSTLRRQAAGVALAALVVPVLAACSGGSGDDQDPAASSSSPTAVSSTEAPYLEVPADVALTTRGSQLQVGQPATVAWQPAADQVGALTITVTKLEKVPLKALAAWTLTSKTRRSQPYFVRATVRNVGAAALDRVSLPLYAVVGTDRYVTASSFETEFKACPSLPLPAKFKPGSSTKLCWVYVAPDHGRLAGVSFYPGPWFDPIVWKGPIDRYEVPSKKQQKR